MSARISWDEYFMTFADIAAKRATCDRLFIGAVIVRGKRILATGYNGSIPGMPHCDEVGHLLVDDHCTATIHAEMNALLQCARFGISAEGATIYSLYSPCWNCFKAIVTAGITRIVFRQLFSAFDERIDQAVKTLNIDYVNLNPNIPAIRPADKIKIDFSSGYNKEQKRDN